MMRVYKKRTTESKPSLLEAVEQDTWVMFDIPTHHELKDFAQKFSLDFDMLNDGVDQNETPRIDYWQGATYIYTRFCLPENQKVTTWPVLIVYTDTLLVTISSKPFTGMAPFLSGDRNFSTVKRGQLLLQLLDEIALGYKKRINSVSKKIWDIRARLDKQHIDNKSFIGMIDIEEDLGDFLSALEPMSAVLHTLMSEKYIKLHEDDKDLAEDIKLETAELITLAESKLRIISNIREAYSTIMANNLNKVFRLMTTITIMMSILTIVSGMYGMNIKLPLSNHEHAFSIIVGGALLFIVTLAILFRRKRWL